MEKIPANNPALNSWVEVDPHSDFPIQNLPFGIFRTKDRTPRVGVAIGNYILDLCYVYNLEFFDELGINKNVFDNEFLNDFIALGKPLWRAVRNRISQILSTENSNKEYATLPQLRENALVKMEDATMQLPVKIGDYTDFYSSIEHATNVGSMFRDPKNALLPNWKHLPVAYHGRASSIVVSGTEIHRPQGQIKPADAENPVFSPTRALDFELETAFIIGKENPLGTSISTAEADDHIFGMVLFNDWSARDIQTWEYVPLGPFLAKNFASSMSPWVVTLDALEPFRVKGPVQQPEVLPYLQYEGDRNIDINLEVYLAPPPPKGGIEGAGTVPPPGGQGVETAPPFGQGGFPICRSNFRYMYWNMEQQLAHHTVNGCNMRIGDVCASGTISGPTPDSFGSMLELTWRGTKPIQLTDGSERKFLNDGDTVVMKGYAEKNGVRVGFGEVSGKIKG